MSERRVLVVDDDEDMVLLLTRLLQKAGYAVVTAYDAAEAVIQAQRELLDLIVLDIVMPEGGGFGVLDRLMTSAQTRTIPIIVLTGSEEPAIEAWARAAGVTHFLRKPCDDAALLEAVRSAVGGPR